MKKMKKSTLIQIIVLGVMVLLIAATFLRIYLWDQGYFTKPFDFSQLSDVIAAEAEDNYGSIDLAGRAERDDGKLTIVVIGDDNYLAADGEKGVCDMLEDMLHATVYNCSFNGLMSANVNASFDVNYGNDAFTFYRLAVAINKQDFSLQNYYIETASNRLAFWDTTLATMQTIDFDSVDVLIFAGGSNDYLNDLSYHNDEDWYDKNTYGGALRSSLELIVQAYPHIDLVVASPSFCYYTSEDGSQKPGDMTRNAAGDFLSDYMIIARDICTMMEISFLDNIFGINITDSNAASYMDETGRYFNEEGKQLLADRLAYFITEVLDYDVNVTE